MLLTSFSNFMVIERLKTIIKMIICLSLDTQGHEASYSHGNSYPEWKVGSRKIKLCQRIHGGSKTWHAPF